MHITSKRYMKLAPILKELRIHYCMKGDSSRGVREFVEKNCPIIIRENRDLSILIRECTGVKPRLWARYAMGRETSLSLANLECRDVVKNIEAVGK